MSKEKAVEFWNQAIANEEVAQQVNKASNVEALMDIAGQHGFGGTEEELVAAGVEVGVFEETADDEQPDDELSDDDLDAVAGGYASAVANNNWVISRSYISGGSSRGSIGRQNLIRSPATLQFVGTSRTSGTTRPTRSSRF